MFAPTLRFDIADGTRSVAFTVDAADLGPLRRMAIANYPALLTAFTAALRDPADPEDAADLARLTLLLLGGHPDHGRDALRNLSGAMLTYAVVIVCVVIDGGRVAFSVGSSGTLEDLRRRLEHLEGVSEVGTVGSWPVVQAH